MSAKFDQTNEFLGRGFGQANIESGRAAIANFAAIRADLGIQRNLPLVQHVQGYYITGPLGDGFELKHRE